MRRAILIHYHEISLKGNNRGWFETRLHQHVRALLQDLPHGGIERLTGRMFVRLEPASPIEEIEIRLRRVFGVANFASAWEVPADMESIRAALADLVRERSFRSFKIAARRGTKNFPLTSQQINEDLGHMVQGLTGAAVRLEAPEQVCYVEIAGASAYLYFERIPGSGGLPTRTGGNVLCLLSGGIDSPVAAFRMMRRGCNVLFVHFHSFPHTTPESQQKVRRLVSILARYQLTGRLLLVPFADVQREIVAYSPPPTESDPLPAFHGPHRRGSGRKGKRTGARYRRQPGPGCEPDPGEPQCRLRRRRSADIPAVDRVRQGGDHADGA